MNDERRDHLNRLNQYKSSSNKYKSKQMDGKTMRLINKRFQNSLEL